MLSMGFPLKSNLLTSIKSGIANGRGGLVIIDV